jgi:hypothetical protein
MARGKAGRNVKSATLVSEILRDQLELAKRSPASCSRHLERAVEAMRDVIVDQGFLGTLNRAFDSLQLLGKLVAWPALLNHLDDHAKMAVGTPETFDDRGMVRRHSFFQSRGKDIAHPASRIWV